MDARKELILDIIIREHIRTGAPVGSSFVVEKYKLDASSATVRNDMAELEDEGYIVQPHTSAGRIPTERGYFRYLEALHPKKPTKIESAELVEAVKDRGEEDLKQAAKTLARLSGQAVFWAFHKNSYYYTGLSNLLAQPEFARPDLVYNISVIIDRLDEIIERIFPTLALGSRVYLGQENPFGPMLGTALVKYRRGNLDGLCGVIGPMRMDYERTIGLVNFVEAQLAV